MDKKCEDFCAENSVSLTKSMKCVYFAYKTYWLRSRYYYYFLCPTSPAISMTLINYIGKVNILLMDILLYSHLCHTFST